MLNRFIPDGRYPITSSPFKTGSKCGQEGVRLRGSSLHIAKRNAPIHLEPTCGWTGLGGTLQRLRGKAERQGGRIRDAGLFFGWVFDKYLTMLYLKEIILNFLVWFVDLAWLKIRTTKVGSCVTLYGGKGLKSRVIMGFNYNVSQLTAAAWHPFNSNPPQSQYRCMVIHMKEGYLIVLFTKNKEHLEEKNQFIDIQG